MPYYNVIKNAKVIGLVETTTKGIIRLTTDNFKFSEKKNLTELSIWCNRKHIQLEYRKENIIEAKQILCKQMQLPV